jgi:hypothetical protein
MYVSALFKYRLARAVVCDKVGTGGRRDSTYGILVLVVLQALTYDKLRS